MRFSRSTTRCSVNDLLGLFIFAASLLCSSLALTNAHNWSQKRLVWGFPKVLDRRVLSRPNRALHSLGPDTTTSETPATTDEETSQSQLDDDPLLVKKSIVVQSSLVVPFSATVAFDAFSDLPRQVEFSPWLHKVEYLNPPDPGVDRTGKEFGETMWVMRYMGIRFSWNSVVSRLERPHTLEWESTSGMKNSGSVEFAPIDDRKTNVTMTMTFVAPRVIVALFRRSNALANTVQNRIIRTTLVNFRDTVEKEEMESRQNSVQVLE